MLRCAIASAAIAAVASSKPNVLFVVVDDLGFTDVGFRSHEIKTPTVDAFARDGVILDQYYVQDVCSPSRATFMTGRYAMHHGIVDWIPPGSAYGLPLTETTMADKFREAGFATHAVGKWHLGFYRPEMTPTFRGFDSFYGFYSGGEDYYKHITTSHYDFRRDSSPRCGPGCSKVEHDAYGLYSTTLFSEEAVRIVQEHPVETPLFLYLAYQAMHSPAQVPEAYKDAYADTIADHKRRTFAGMLSCMDEGLSNVTAALTEKGMMDNTLVVFTTDNGGPINTGDGIGARNWPLRGAKHSIWEGGTRGTAVVYGKMLKKKGYTFTHLMHGADWLPTLAAVAGFDTSTIPLPLDGVNQWAALNEGNEFTQQRTDFVYGNSTNNCKWMTAGLQEFEHLQVMDNIPCGFGIRDNQWKLTLGWGGGPDTWCNKTDKGLVCKDFTNQSYATSEASCSEKEKLCLPGNDLSSFNAVSSSDCCEACANTSGCVAYTFNLHNDQEDVGAMCYLKKDVPDEATSGNDCTSATIGVPFPPSPSPTPSGSACVDRGFCLWDVVADPGEHTEVSAVHPEVVDKLKVKMAETLATYNQYQVDRNCGKVTYEDDDVVGPAWAPWCYLDEVSYV